MVEHHHDASTICQCLEQEVRNSSARAVEQGTSESRVVSTGERCRREYPGAGTTAGPAALSYT
jgi:hypothetical protein